MLLVDHDMSLVLGVCDTVHVLDYGRIIASGTPAEIRSDSSVIEAYLGQQGVGAVIEPLLPTTETVLDVRNLAAGYDRVPVVHGIDLTVRAGEVVALLGGNGAGKTTTIAHDLRAAHTPRG